MHTFFSPFVLCFLSSNCFLYIRITTSLNQLYFKNRTNQRVLLVVLNLASIQIYSAMEVGIQLLDRFQVLHQKGRRKYLHYNICFPVITACSFRSIDKTLQSFIGGLGPGQIVGRQTLAASSLGEIEVRLTMVLIPNCVLHHSDPSIIAFIFCITSQQ